MNELVCFRKNIDQIQKQVASEDTKKDLGGELSYQLSIYV